MRCSSLRSIVTLSVGLSVPAHGRAVQKRLNGSTSGLGWRLLRDARWQSPSPMVRWGFDADFAKLLWLLILGCQYYGDCGSRRLVGSFQYHQHACLLSTVPLWQYLISLSISGQWRGAGGQLRWSAFSPWMTPQFGYQVSIFHDDATVVAALPFPDCTASLRCLEESMEPGSHWFVSLWWKQTMSHIVDSCPLSKLNGGVLQVQFADDEAVSLLISCDS